MYFTINDFDLCNTNGMYKNRLKKLAFNTD